MEAIHELPIRFARRVAPIVAALTIVGGLTALPAQASDGAGSLCRAIVGAGVYRPTDGRWIYTIPVGHDMRVHRYSPSAFTYFGHGEGHTDDGWAYAENFIYCRYP